MDILKKEKELSIKKLEKKLNIGYQTVLPHCKELAYFGVITMTTKNIRNGKPYRIVRLLDAKFRTSP